MKATNNQSDFQIVVNPMNAADKQEKDRQFVTALARGLELLRCFTPRESTLSNLDLARKSGLPRPTVSRLTHTLARLGYLRLLPRGKYQLDVGVMAFGYSMISNLPIRAIAQPLMVNLANEVGATVAMSARDRLDMVYLDVIWRIVLFGAGLGPWTRPDASGSPRYRWARAQSRIWSRFCRKS